MSVIPKPAFRPDAAPGDLKKLTDDALYDEVYNADTAVMWEEEANTCGWSLEGATARLEAAVCECRRRNLDGSGAWAPIRRTVRQLLKQ